MAARGIQYAVTAPWPPPVSAYIHTWARRITAPNMISAEPHPRKCSSNRFWARAQVTRPNRLILEA